MSDDNLITYLDGMTFRKVEVYCNNRSVWKEGHAEHVVAHCLTCANGSLQKSEVSESLKIRMTRRGHCPCCGGQT